jgi:dTDP-4-amino-4,6-dideoxygalactose transaminase
MNVPFVDLRAQYLAIKHDVDRVMHDVVEEMAFVRGKYVQEFERAFACQYGVKHCISVANGTDAIFITLKMLGIGVGDEVITTANSWIATSETIGLTGATPVFVDVEADGYCIDAQLIESKITEKTKAILPVHLYGHPAQIDLIKEICERHGLFLLEDCAQAHFASLNDVKVGTFGIAGTFSFYPGKNLGAYGDAGAIITNDDAVASKVRMFANHGSLKKHEHEIEGVNSRMDGLQAAVLGVKLPHILDWNSARLANALRYNELLSGICDMVLPAIRDNALHTFHLYVIRTQRRDGLQQHLKEHGISTGIHYPTALPFLRAYSYQGHSPEDFPVAHKYQGEILSLPMFPELSDESAQYVATTIRQFFDKQ